MKRILARVFAAIVILLVVVAVVLLWMADGVQAPKTFDDPPRQTPGVAATTSTATPDTLTVVTWNIAWGYGWGSEGSGGTLPKAHFDESIARIGEVLKALNPDVVLLQEVDFDCGRSYSVDQAEAIAKQAGLPWIARAEVWRANYLPFPYWPPQNHYGHMLSGGAVLSRFPMKQNTIIEHPKPEENSFVYNLGYMFRYLQEVEVDWAGQSLLVFNTHTDAFSPKNRLAHAGSIARTLTDRMQPLLLFGGDLNTVPPEASVRSGYPDEPETSHDEDATIPRLRQVKGLSDAVSPERLKADEADFMTFPAHAPNRKLDYLFYGPGFEVLEVRVVKEAGDVSDHLPVMVRLRRRH
ncbi:MAG: endonuclease/exonuclease/phosphatase family protein [Deltaproteobacteria bacterium]|nr:endonuclease/exonuclease/phosphatase family protein [Deltaproteobacteria bacterium]